MLSSLLGNPLFRLNDQVTLNSKEETNPQLSLPLSPVKFLYDPAVEPAPEVQVIPFQGLQLSLGGTKKPLGQGKRRTGRVPPWCL